MPVLIKLIIALFKKTTVNSSVGKPFLLTILFVLSICWFPNTGSAKEATVQRILVLNSYHYGYEWSDNVMEGIRAVLENNASQVEVWFEFLDTKRHSPEKIFSRFYRLLKEKHQHHPFDVVIVSDNNAFSFALSFRKQLFQNVPIVFCGVNNYDDSMTLSQKGITGVAEEVDLKGTIELALKLNPDTLYIASVSGVTKTSQAVLEKLRKIKKHFEQSLTFIELAELTPHQLASRLKELPEKTIILHLTYFLDKKGKSYTLNESVQIIKSNSNLPIYSTWDFMVREGTTGGIVTSGTTQGETAAKLALRILNGETADSIPVIRKSPNVSMFDFHQLQHFDIDLDMLPEGSVVINQPKSFYYHNKEVIWSVIIFLFLQTIVIVFLALNIGKRRKAEEKLTQYRNHLEELVKNRTEDLTATNAQLEEEVTERQKADEEIRMSHAELDQIFNTVTDGMRIINKEHEVIRVNKTFLDLTGLSEKKLIGQKCYHVFPGSQCDTPDCPLYKITNGAHKVEYEAVKARTDGKKIPCIVTATPFRDPKGNLLGIIETFKDITLRKQLENRLLELSITDELTSLLNRRGFVEMAEKQLRLADRLSGDLFLLYADLDNMKWINDQLGHKTGDKALADTAHLLLSTFRDTDVIGRLGGDEFAVLLAGAPGMDNEKIIIKRFEKKINSLNNRMGRLYKISVSTGIIKYDHINPLSVDELLEQADELMYEVKKRKKQDNE